MKPSERSAREKDIFEHAIELPSPEARLGYVQGACGRDEALFARVQTLLRAHEAVGAFAGDTFKTTRSLGPAESAEQPGSMIGRYKLLQQLGEGGCGTVYMAEQEEPVRRRVALKVIKLGMDTKAVIARFEAERQALAMMDHPNIAKVLDAGATDTGRPYFVMELVRGMSITQYCDDRNLPTIERLNLFTQVCHAIQHAHQKGIIHRDIKPSNILVTLHDGVPIPKVIDFGIAKATLGRLTDQTVFTAFEQFIGTPAYMSPEQAEMSGLDIDTRSDIYSLGVLLYELLTGKPPFDPKSLLQSGLDEIRRVIREVEPPKPSTRLTTLTSADCIALAKLRGTDPAKLSVLLRGDLDWIVMRCLEKDRMRRYESASAVAADIGRHLHNEPVTASPPSATYLLQKLVRRNRLAFAAAAAIAAALVIGLGVAMWAFVQEKAARERAVAAEREQRKARAQAESARNNESQQRALAEEARGNEAKQRLAAEAEEKKAKMAAAKSEQAFRFMGQMLTGIGPSVAAGRDTTLLREIVDKTIARLATHLKEQPEISISIRLKLASVYMDLGDYTKGEALAREALVESEKIYGRKGEEFAYALTVQSMARLTQGQAVESEAMAREAVALMRQLPDKQDAKVAKALFVLGVAQVRQAKFREAETALREVLAVAQREADQEELPVDVILTTLAAVLEKQGRLGEAEPMLRDALALQKSRLADGHPLVAISMAALANVLLAQGKVPEAETLFHETLAALKKSMGPEHPTIATILPNLAVIALRKGKRAEAETTLREAVALQTKVLGPNHPVLAGTRQLLAQVLQQQGKSAEAETEQREAQVIQRKAIGNPEHAAADDKASAGVAAWQKGNWAEAERNLSEALPVSEQVNGRTHISTLSCRLMLADAIYRQDRFAESEAILRELVAASREGFGNKSSFLGNALLNLSRSLERQGKLAETESNLREMLAISKTFTTDGENALVADAMLLLALIQARLGHAADASVLVKDAAVMSRKLPEAQQNNVLGVAESMATTLKKERKLAEAETVERTALEFLIARDGRDGNPLAQLLVRLAQTLNQAGRFDEAEPFAREGWLLRKKLRPASDWTVANGRSALGDSLLGAKKYAEAETELLGAFADMESNATDSAKATPNWKSRQRQNAAALVKLYGAIEQPGKAAEWKLKQTALTEPANPATAKSTGTAKAAAAKSTTGKSPTAKSAATSGGPDLAALVAQDDELRRQRKFVEAEAVERQVLALAIARDGKIGRLAATTAHKLAGTLNLLEKFAEAEPFARDALTFREKDLAAGDWNIASTRSSLGASLLGQKKFAEAEPVLLRAYAELVRAEPSIPASSKSRIRDTATSIDRLYADSAQPEKAAEWKRKAEPTAK
jgi:eukaryotic-like serine/threonine-protein kinase